MKNIASSLSLVFAAGLIVGCGAVPSVGGVVPDSASVSDINESAEAVQETAQDVQATAGAGQNATRIADLYVRLNAHGDMTNGLAANASLELVDAETIEGSANVGTYYTDRWSTTPDLMFYPERVLAGDEFVVVQAIQRGTSMTALGEEEGASVPFGTHSLHTYTYVGGELTEIQYFTNRMSLLEQLGDVATEMGMPVPATPEGEPQIEILPGNAGNVAIAISAVDAAAAVDANTLRSLAAADATVHNYVSGQEGIPFENYIAHQEEMATMFTDMNVEHIDTVSFGDNWVFASYAATGTTGTAAMTITLANVYRLEDGEIAELWIYGDPSVMAVTE